MLYLAGVKAVRYTGVKPKKLWEVGGRNVPVLNRGDIVFVGETVAISLTRGSRRSSFEMVNAPISVEIDELPEIIVEEVAEENQGEENQGEENQGEENQGEENQGEENPPADLDRTAGTVSLEEAAEEAKAAANAPKKKGK